MADGMSPAAAARTATTSPSPISVLDHAASYPAASSPRMCFTPLTPVIEGEPKAMCGEPAAAAGRPNLLCPEAKRARIARIARP